jgi:hypothetical protein
MSLSLFLVLLITYIVIVHDVKKYTRKIMLMLIHLYSCALNFMLPELRQNFAEVARLKQKAEEVYSKRSSGRLSVASNR